MGVIIGDAPCEMCQANGHDSTGNHKMLFEDGGEYCSHSEYHSDNKPYIVKGENYKQEEHRDMFWTEYTPDEIKKNLPNGSDPKRKISKETAKSLGIRVEYNTESGEVDKVFYPYFDGKELGYKLRKRYEEGDREVKNKPELLGKLKCFRAVGNTKGSLFNQHNVPRGSKKVILVEGEEDCAASVEMLEKYNPRVLSIPSGASVDKDGNGILDKAILENIEYLDSMKEVCISFDNDSAGEAIAKELSKVLSTKVSLMKLSEKDASDVRQKGKDSEFVSAYFDAKVYIPDSLMTVADVRDEAIKIPEWGRKWPWPTLNSYTYGRRDGEGIYVGSAVKGGKTEWLSQMADHIINVEGLKPLLCKFEQTPAQTVTALAGKLKNKRFNKPDHFDAGKFTQEDLTEAVDSLDGKVLIFNASFSDVGKKNMWDRIKPAIKHAVLHEGVKDVFIDPITQLTDGMSPSETETELRRFSNEIQGMAQDYGFFYYCFAHLKEPVKGLTHEEGGSIKVAQFRGSRSMAEKTKLMLAIIRNQFADDIDERNTSIFHLLLNSSFGDTGKFPVTYDPEQGSYLEPEQSIVEF